MSHAQTLAISASILHTFHSWGSTEPLRVTGIVFWGVWCPLIIHLGCSLRTSPQTIHLRGEAILDHQILWPNILGEQQRFEHHVSILLIIWSTRNLSKTCRVHLGVTVPPQDWHSSLILLLQPCTLKANEVGEHNTECLHISSSIRSFKKRGGGTGE